MVLNLFLQNKNQIKMKGTASINKPYHLYSKLRSVKLHHLQIRGEFRQTSKMELYFRCSIGF